MKKIYIVGVQKRENLPLFIEELKNKRKNLAIIDKEDVLRDLKDKVFSEFYPNIPKEEINSSDEYLYTFKNIEYSHTDNLISSICSNSQDTDIVVYGEFFIPFCDREWRDNLNAHAKLNNFDVSLFFLHGENENEEEFAEKRKAHSYRGVTDVRIKKIKSTSYITKLETADEIHSFISSMPDI